MGDEVWVLRRMLGSKIKKNNRWLEKIEYLIGSFKIYILLQVYVILGSRRINVREKQGS
jgi:hypothetical protein